MDDRWLADRFEEHRRRLRAVAYRILGSLTEADDAVQDTWLQLSRSDAGEIENLGGWLTTVVGRVALNRLRTRARRREDALAVRLPDPVVRREGERPPEDEVVLVESVGLAMLVALDTLAPAERVAFVLHDVFALPFEEIAPLLDRSTAATRQLASRARRRVRSAEVPTPDPDGDRQREAVDAFLSAARDGDLDALVAVLDPDVVVRIAAAADRPASSMVVNGAEAAARQMRPGLRSTLGRPTVELHPVLVNGAAGMVVTQDGQPLFLLAFTVAHGWIAEIDVFADPARVGRLTEAALAGGA